ncbi:MAG: response regulator [Deltaproteobacteria bacterium]|nr:response regulator [Deltaproteobacteria bacterium]
MITEDSKNILIADDSVFFRTKLSDILIEAGHLVRFAKDGREVINEIKIDSNGIDLLILDLQMPDIDGFGVLKWMKENGYEGKFPVLAITGVYELSQVTENLKGLGAAGLMTKGFTPEQIIFRVNRALFPDKIQQGAPRERVPVSVPVDFSIGELTRTGFLLNVSESGAFLHTKADILTGSLIRLKFSLTAVDRLFDIKGIVKWSTTEVATKTLFGGYGIMFTSMTGDERKLLSEFVVRELKRIGMDVEPELALTASGGGKPPVSGKGF